MRADLHCHSTASQVSRLGIQRSIGLPECATPPEEVYELAKRRGMDFVTITDHDTIAGALEIADRPGAFVSEELTAWFRGEPQAVHVLCYGISPDDHERLQERASDLEAVAAYLHEHALTCALAHPFYSVAAPLEPRHRRRLAEMFPVWETRNGSRAHELNMPARIWVETRGGTGVGGSDDHAGIDIGRTFTVTPPAASPDEFLAHIRAGRADAHGDEGSAEKWAHAALALASRTLGEQEAPPPDPLVVLSILQRVVREAARREGVLTADVGPDAGRALLAEWRASLGLPGDVVALMQEPGFSHTELYRRARRAHERALREAVLGVMEALDSDGSLLPVLEGLFTACVPIVPYAPAAAFLGREKERLSVRGGAARVALLADGIASMHGVTRTLEELRQRGVPGFTVEVIGTDADVDRRLPAACEVEVPHYPGLTVGVPSVPALVETLAEGRYDLVHVCSPGPAGVLGALIARIMELPTVGSYHTELGPYVGFRSGDPRLRAGMDAALSVFYGACGVVLSPSAAADESLEALGIPRERLTRWDRGVDTARFDPARRDPSLLPGELTVMYAGRVTREKGIELLADAFLHASRSERGLHLVVAGGGPEEEELRSRLGERVTFLGWLNGEDLARAYASADIFVFPSSTDTFGQVVLEAQASGLPVACVARGGPLDLVADRATGLLAAPSPAALGDAIAELARSKALRRGLGERGRASARRRGWEAAMERLAQGYRRSLASAAPGIGKPPGLAGEPPRHEAA
ncbi:MAG TPA: glycosyltransferase [Thermoleophilaceae bacterium]|nr:glycosyltransferase [Thermoleophilaceae bacterium]